MFVTYIINKLCWEYNVVEKPGYIVLYFFAILNSCFIENYYVSNIQIGNMFVLIGMNYLYMFIKNNYDRRWLFLSALFYGMAALCIPEHFWVIVFLIVIVILFKPILPVDIFAILFLYCAHLMILVYFLFYFILFYFGFQI